MKALILAIMLAFGIIPSWAYKTPEVNTEGLIWVEVKNGADGASVSDSTAIPAYREQDAIALAKMLWGEARGCAYDDKRNCCITACNRAMDARFPDTVYDCVVQPYQYLGYAESNPVVEELYAIAVSVLQDMELHKNGETVEWYSYNAFYGDGVQNHFYTV